MCAKVGGINPPEGAVGNSLGRRIVVKLMTDTKHRAAPERILSAVAKFLVHLLGEGEG